MVKSPSEFYSENAEEHGEKFSLGKVPDQVKKNLEHFLKVLNGQRVLVPGCGSGRDLRFFSDRDLDVIGFDLAEGMVEESRSRDAGDVFLMDMMDLGFSSSVFDGVWTCGCIYFLEKPGMREALEEFSRVLRDGGVLYVDFKTGSGRVLKEEFGDEVYEFHVDVSEARKMIEEAGFEIIDMNLNKTDSRNSVFANFFARKK